MQKLIFFGSSSYSVPVLETLLEYQASHKDSLTLSAVITTSDKPAGRHLKLTPNPVKVLAAAHHLPVYEKASDYAASGSPSRDNPVGLVAAYGRIIKPEILNIFGDHIYNIHPSLLPLYRGPSPLQQQILDGITQTGVTIIRLDDQMDHGPIAASTFDQISDTDTPETLGKRLFVKGTNLFIEKVLHSSRLELTIQDDSQASYTAKLSRADGYLPYEEFIRLTRSPAPELIRKFRAFYPWPGIWSTTPDDKRVKLISIDPLQTRIST